MTPKPLILAIETSSRIGSVALAQGPDFLAQTTFSAAMQHSREIFPAISDLLIRFARRPKDIQHIYVSIGPGSFTGLRIATAIAKSMHLANAVKIIAVDSLDVIAANVTNPSPNTSNRSVNHVPPAAELKLIAPLLDAKRGQFYVAVYKPSKTKNATGAEKFDSPQAMYEKVHSDSLLSTAQIVEMFANSDKTLHLLGDGLLYHEDAFRKHGVYILDKSLWSPQAHNVHSLGWKMATQGQFVDPLALAPHYIRRPEAEEKWEKLTDNL